MLPPLFGGTTMQCSLHRKQCRLSCAQHRLCKYCHSIFRWCGCAALQALPDRHVTQRLGGAEMLRLSEQHAVHGGYDHGSCLVCDAELGDGVLDMEVHSVVGDMQDLRYLARGLAIRG